MRAEQGRQTGRPISRQTEWQPTEIVRLGNQKHGRKKRKTGGPNQWITYLPGDVGHSVFGTYFLPLAFCRVVSVISRGAQILVRKTIGYHHVTCKQSYCTFKAPVHYGTLTYAKYIHNELLWEQTEFDITLQQLVKCGVICIIKNLLSNKCRPYHCMRCV